MAPSDESEVEGENVPEFASDERDPRYRLLRPREWRTYTRYHFLLAKIIFFGAIAFITYWALSALSGVLFPLFASLIIAYLFDPLIDWLEEQGVGRTVGILITLVTGLGLVALFVLILHPTIVQQIEEVADGFPDFIQAIEEQAFPWIETNLGYDLPKNLEEGVKQYGKSVSDSLPGIVDQAGGWARGIVSGTGAIISTVVYTITIPIFSFYFLRDFDRIRLKLTEFLPEHRRDYLITRAREMDEVVGEWVRGQLQVASILAVLYSVGLIFPFLAGGLGVRAAVTVGVVAGMLNFIPYLGVGVGIVFSVLLVVINWSGPGPLIGAIGVFAAVQTLEGYFITPRIVGEKVGLSPVTVIIVLLIGGEVYGFFGILLAVPVFGAFKVLLPDIIEYYKETPFFTGRRLVPDALETREPKREGDGEKVGSPEERAPDDGTLETSGSDVETSDDEDRPVGESGGTGDDA